MKAQAFIGLFVFLAGRLLLTVDALARAGHDALPLPACTAAGKTGTMLKHE